MVPSRFGFLCVPHQGRLNLALSNYMSFITKKYIFEVRLHEPVRQISFKTHRMQQFSFVDPWAAVLMALSLDYQWISSITDILVFKNVRNLNSIPSLAGICGLTVQMYLLLLSLKNTKRTKT